MIHHKGNEHSQGHRDTDTGATPLQALTIGDHRHRRQARSRSVLSLQENTDTGGTPTGGQEHTGATPSPLLLAPVGSRSPSRSMMIHRKGNERSQGHRRTPTGLHLYRLLPLATGHRRGDTLATSVLSLQENTDTGGQDTDTGDRLAPVGSLSLSVYDDAPQRK